MTIKTLGMGAIRSNVFSKIAKSKKKTPGEEHFDTVYKLDKTGKKDKIIESLNAQLKKNPKSFPKLLDAYTKIMGSDFAQKTGPYFKRLKRDKDK